MRCAPVEPSFPQCFINTVPTVKPNQRVSWILRENMTHETMIHLDGNSTAKGSAEEPLIALHHPIKPQPREVSRETRRLYLKPVP